MSLSLIVAMSENRVIGKNNEIPWHLSPDFKYFKETTQGHPIVMGRKTYESLGGALPKRKNYVLTRNQEFKLEDAHVIQNVTEVAELNSEEEVFIIGGSEIYKMMWEQVDKFYVTKIYKEFEGDTFFPEISEGDEFQVFDKSDVLHDPKSGLNYQYFIYTRR